MIDRIRVLGLALLIGAAFGHPARAINLAPPDLANPAPAASINSDSWGSSWTAPSASASASSSLQGLSLGSFRAPTPAPASTADGFVNFGSGPYPAAASLATGSPQAWYTSPEVAAVFGGTPTASQQASFQSAVFQLTQQTFQLSGVGVNLTDDPTVSAAHTLSLVSGSSSIPFPGSIGTTNIGGSGFSFIDQEAASTPTVGQLELIVAHNLAHELMLSFGVPEQYDQTGKYIDSTTLPWSTITNPYTTFSPAAAAAINQALQSARDGGGIGYLAPLAQYMDANAVPEPATWVGWSLGLLALAAASKRRARRSAR